MKTFFLALLILGISSACTNTKDKNAKELLSDPGKRTEIFNAITNDSIYSKDLLQKMMGNEQSRLIMTEDPSVMKMMCMSGNMDSLIKNDRQVMENMTDRLIKKMEADSIACDRTCTRMTDNENIKNTLQKISSKK